jgi:hypothetical protein
VRKLVTENHVKALVKDWFDKCKGWSYAPIQNGLGVHGIPDRVGVVPVTVTPDMVGRKVGVFIGVECKKPGRRGEKDRGMSKHQVMTLTDINAAWGHGMVCDGYEDLAQLHNRLFQQELPLG